MFGDDCEPLVLSPLSFTSDDLENNEESKEETPEFTVQFKNTSQPAARPLLTRIVPSDSGSLNEDLLITPHGTVQVVKDGNLSGPAMITFHDLGLNGVANFQVNYSVNDLFI